MVNKGPTVVARPAPAAPQKGAGDDATLDAEGSTAPAPGGLLPLPARYLDQGPLGAGGMGEVRRVLDQVLNRTLAMKVIRSDYAGHIGMRARFLREACITAGLSHPGIVAVHDQGELADRRLWYTMQEVRGQTLEALLHQLPLRRRIEVLLRAAQAIGYAHRQGFIHRDIKPSNLMVGAFGEVLVLDWGLARPIEGEPTEDDDSEPTLVMSEGHSRSGRRKSSHPGLATQFGTVMGTRAYMSPEQADGRPVGPPTDVYAFGMTLHDILAVEENPPPELCEIRRLATRTQPGDRYPDAVPFAEALHAWLDGAKRRAEALAILEQARGLLAPLARARDEAEHLARQADALLAPLPPHAPVAQKIPGWRLGKRAQEQARAVRLLEIELVQKARAALERSEDLVEAHELLADLYQQRAAEAELRRDADALAEYLALLQTHDRGQHAAWLSGEGRLTLHTDPPAGRLTLYRLVEEDRTLVPCEPRVLGRSPVVDVSLAPGSYEIHIDAPGRAPVVVPVLIERCAAWQAGPPQDPHRPVYLPPEVGPDEVYVPAGWFQCGGDPLAIDGLPHRRIWVDGFVMQRHPVTHQDYLVFLNELVAQGREAEALRWVPRADPGMSDTPHQLYARTHTGTFEPMGESLDYPVVGVDWLGACAFAAWYSGKTHQAWRLPHELEREKAARGVDGRLFPWGDTFEPTWTRSLNSVPGPPARVSVHAFPEDTSCLGIRGLAGNVRDWCVNVFMKAPPEEGSALEVVVDGSNTRDFRAVRGGSMTSGPDLCRAATRFGALPDHRRSALGFRLVRPCPG